MNPKEKAIELVDKYHKGEPYLSYAGACKCALIAVEEIIDFLSDDPYYKDYNFYQQVKTELTNL